ncbi:MFS transporter [Pelagibius sp. Alg239-R121]|uniref:MFS transporter n=1 Tax=Pelagibius sp. Alg239-R121 TaxID=2993448 RepID=UPI0024A60D65|nr:MFS transporter [Pelagibius sp. Alg239-R121]
MSRRLWIIVLCGGAIMALSLGFRHSLGLFLSPVSADLGIGRGSFALGMGLMNLVWGAASPFAGAIADRYGAGRVAALGGICYSAGLLAMTLSGQGDQLLLGGALIGIGLSGAGFSVVLGTVGRAAPPERRSTALGIASMCGSIGQFAALPYTHLMIDGIGWYAAIVVLAGTALLIVPLSLGLAGAPPDTQASADQTLRQAFDEAWGDRSFWLLNAGFFVCGFHLAFVAVHLPAYLADFGFEPWLAVAGLTTVGVFNILGSYGCGVLGERYSKKKLLSLLYLARAFIFLAFLVVPISETSVIVFSAAIGLLWLGTVPLTSGLVAHIFGTTYMSMLFGMVFLGHQFGGFLGAWLAGYIYDWVGSYDFIWWLSVGLGVASALLHWPITERPVPRLITLPAAQ